MEIIKITSLDDSISDTIPLELALMFGFGKVFTYNDLGVLTEDDLQENPYATPLALEQLREFLQRTDPAIGIALTADQKKELHATLEKVEKFNHAIGVSIYAREFVGYSKDPVVERALIQKIFAFVPKYQNSW